MKISLLFSTLMLYSTYNTQKCNAEYVCYDNSTALKEAMANHTGIFPTTWHVCPGTTWNMGRWNKKKSEYTDGDHPIVLSRTGTKVLCGPNGDVKDKCSLVGGSTGIEIINGKWYKKENNEVVLDLLIQGFTFTGANETDSIYVYAKDLSQIELTVKNCHFVDNPKLWKSLNIGVDNINGKETIKVEDCLFENNNIVEDPLSQVGALITGWNSPQISIVRSEFNKNSADASVLVPYLIFAPCELINSTTFDFASYSQINIKDSCFTQNKDFWFSLAHSTNGNDDGIVSGNYQSSNSYLEEGKACNGVSYSFKRKDSQILASHICKKGGFSASTCPLVTSQPSSQPTSQPSSQPTSQPSSQPTSQPTIEVDTSTARKGSHAHGKTLVLIVSATYLYFS